MLSVFLRIRIFSKLFINKQPLIFFVDNKQYMTIYTIDPSLGKGTKPISEFLKRPEIDAERLDTQVHNGIEIGQQKKSSNFKKFFTTFIMIRIGVNTFP